MHWVFAYGSNMHQADLARWLAQSGYVNAAPRRVTPAVLHDWELCWNYRSAARQGGAANVRPCTGSLLPGVALLGDDTLLTALDAKEGHPTRYDRGDAPVPVRLLEDDAVVDAWLYRVAAARLAERDVAPRAAYLSLLLQAAEEHALDPAHRRRLGAVVTWEQIHAS